MQWSWKTIVLGFGFLIFLLTARLTVSNNLSPNSIFLNDFTVNFEMFSNNLVCFNQLTELEETKAFLDFSSSSINFCYSVNSFSLPTQI